MKEEEEEVVEEEEEEEEEEEVEDEVGRVLVKLDEVVSAVDEPCPVSKSSGPLASQSSFPPSCNDLSNITRPILFRFFFNRVTSK